jgi:predicted Zn-dependent protease
VRKLQLFFTAGLALAILFASSCSSVRIPTVSDYQLERRVADEAAPIIRVTKDRDRSSSYRIHLADFPRKDILGMSVGERTIYISYELARAAFKNANSRWLLRQILAHEVAHELSGHAHGGSTPAYDRAPHGVITAADVGLPSSVQFQNYSLDKELEADRVGLEYWKTLGWDCGIWVNILRGFQSRNYAGDAFHPTEDRLRQAIKACPKANAS